MTRVTMELLPDGVRRKIVVHYGHITDGNFLSNLLGEETPDEIYPLAAQSFVVTVSRMLYQHTVLI